MFHWLYEKAFDQAEYSKLLDILKIWMMDTLLWIYAENKQQLLK